MINKKLVISLAVIIGSFILMVLDIRVFRHLKGGAVVVEFFMWLLLVVGITEWWITKKFLRVFPHNGNDNSNKEKLFDK